MRIPEDEKIRLAFEKRAFHTSDPEFRKDEVWQKIQMRLESPNNNFKNKYTLAILILLFFTLVGWMITFYQYSQLEKRNIVFSNSEQKTEKDNLQVGPNDKITKPIPKLNKKEIFSNQRIYSKSFVKVRTEEFHKHDIEGDTLKEAHQNKIIAELVNDESLKITELEDGNEIKKKEDNYTFSYKKNYKSKKPMQMDPRKIKIQLFIHEADEVNPQEMRIAELNE